MDRHLGGIEIEADDATADARALPLAIVVPGWNKGEFAPERSQGRRQQITDTGLALVANAFFVDEQQMACVPEPKFDLVVGGRLNDLDFDAVPCARAAADHISWSDLDCAATYVADLGIRQLPSPAVARLNAFLEAAVAPQE